MAVRNALDKLQISIHPTCGEKGGEEMKKKSYTKDLPKRMYSYFCTFSESGAPSFGKFARSIGVTLEELESFRVHGNFDRAWRECSEIRRDYLIDSALTKRHDSSFSKFLLGIEFKMDEDKNEDGRLDVTLEVLAK